MKKKILFVTGTRADFGKLRPLIEAVAADSKFEYRIFCTGMHTLARYGNTANEIYRAGFSGVHTFMNQVEGEAMEVVLANTVIGLSRYLHENPVDMIVVHGDRVEAMAGATVGALRNMLVAHVEGGEISGTVDELMRHAVSKLSHIHFVASTTASRRLLQLGEVENSIYCIGSPDIDVMLSPDLPPLATVKERYGIEFESYAIALMHPVTTELDRLARDAERFVDALLQSGDNFVVIYPNNDQGTDLILKAYERLCDADNVRVFPSVRFEYFLVLLREALYICGNSSAGIHEAPVYGVPTINVGTRQLNRFNGPSIRNVEFDTTEILAAIKDARMRNRHPPTDYYGRGNSAQLFIEALRGDLWSIARQKQFQDIRGASYVQRYENPNLDYGAGRVERDSAEKYPPTRCKAVVGVDD